jgi:hypothetical protein
MNFEQLRLLLEGAIGKEAAIKQIVKLLGPYRQQAAQEIKGIIERLPDVNLAREKAFKQMADDILRVYGGYGEVTYRALIDTTPKIGGRSRKEAEANLKAAGIPASNLAANVEVPYSDIMNQVRVGERTLRDLLVSTYAAPAPFALSNMASINKFVRTEMFKQVPTEKIAANVITQVIKQLSSTTNILAAESVYEFDRIVRENIEDANIESITLAGLQWEWVTMLDSKTCAICAPMSGQVQERKEDFETPFRPHIGCRCDLRLIDPQDEKPIRKGHTISENKLEGDNAYKRKRNTKGTKYWEKTDDFKGDYDQWLADQAKRAKTTNPLDMRKVNGRRNIDMHTLTVREALGSSKRAARYIKAIQGGEAPYIALMRAIRSN